MGQLILGKTDFPNIDLLDIGKVANIGYGTVEDVTTHAIVGGATSLLAAAIDDTETSLTVQDASRYPAVPFVTQIMQEIILVSAKSGTTFSSLTRGYLGTIAKSHSADQTVFEVRTEYVYLMSNYPVKAINDVYIDGKKQLVNFTAYTGQSGDEHTDWPGKAVIAFSAQQFIGQQFNIDIDSAVADANGVIITPTVFAKSKAELTDGDSDTWQPTSIRLRPLEGSTWIVSTSYPTTGVLAVPSTGAFLDSGFYYRLDTTGQSGGGQPTWTTLEGSTVTDNSLVWNCRGKITPFTSAWVAWNTGTGTVIKQTYTIVVAQDGAIDRNAKVIITNITTGDVAIYEDLVVPGLGAKTTFVIEQAGGDWDTMCTVMPVDTELKVYEISKTVTKVRSELDSVNTSTLTYPPKLSSNSQLRDGVADNSFLIHEQQVSEGWLLYPASTLGTIDKQVLTASVTPLTTCSFKLILLNTSGVSEQLFKLSSSTSSTSVSSTFSGGAWEDSVKVKIQTGQVNVHELTRAITYEISGVSGLTATSSARIVVGAVISADTDFFEDLTGDYGGINTLIERPDNVIKHFIDVLYGFTLATDVDSTSFDAAGVLYAAEISGGYKFAFVITRLIVPSQFLQGLAFQCRSVLKYQAGKWFLDFLPDTAPAVVDTIKKTELAGDNAMFQFTKTFAVDIQNNITVRFKRNYGFVDVSESEWHETSTASDATSQTLNGDRPATIDLEAVRFQTMADNVTAHILLQRKNSLLRVTFPVFWEHFDLDRGDTFDIDNPLYDTTKFFIEDYDKKNDGTVKITGLQWY